MLEGQWVVHNTDIAISGTSFSTKKRVKAEVDYEYDRIAMPEQEKLHFYKEVGRQVPGAGRSYPGPCKDIEGTFDFFFTLKKIK